MVYDNMQTRLASGPTDVCPVFWYSMCVRNWQDEQGSTKETAKKRAAAHARWEAVFDIVHAPT